jgi:hypothetical protein
MVGPYSSLSSPVDLISMVLNLASTYIVSGGALHIV